jgi:hypothetical protein
MSISVIEDYLAQWTEKGGHEQFTLAKSPLNRDYVHYVDSNEL